VQLTLQCQNLAVSLTQARHALLVSLTPVSNFSTVLLTPEKLSKAEKASLVGVINTGEDFLASVNETGNACITGVVGTSEKLKLSNFCELKKSKLSLDFYIGTRSSLPKIPEVKNLITLSLKCKTLKAVD
jgi:hypothetical protein